MRTIKSIMSWAKLVLAKCRCLVCPYANCDVCPHRPVSGYDTFTELDESKEGKGQKRTGSSTILTQKNKKKRADKRKGAARDWLNSHKGAKGIRANKARRKEVQIKDVLYIPERTYNPLTEKRGKASMLCLLLEDEAQEYLVNIRDDFKRFVGNCSKQRTGRLKECTPATIIVENGTINRSSLVAWFKEAKMPIK